MDIPGLAGNEKIKDWVRKAAYSRTLPHAVLITGDEGSGKRALAAYLAAAYVCSSERPACLECRHCKKAAQGLHPDITVLDPAGKLIPVEEIRRIRSDAYIRPNEAERKVYIIIGAERIKLMMGCTIKELSKNENNISISFNENNENIEVDGIFVSIGSKPNNSLFIEEYVKYGLDLFDHPKVNFGNVWVCGDCLNNKYKQAIVSAGEGAKVAIEIFKEFQEK